MITEDQLERLAIQWFQDTGWENIEHRTPNIEHRREEKRRLTEGVAAEREALRNLAPAFSQGEREEDGSLAEAVGTRSGGLPPAMRDALCDLQKLVNARSAFRSAQTMRGPWGSGLPRFMGIPWAQRSGRISGWCPVGPEELERNQNHEQR
jgi:hypothetical protein